MKELFRERDYTRIGYFQSILESEGIATIVRNKDLNGAGITEVPIPEFFPALCVMNDEDYQPAIEILRQHVEHNAVGSDTERLCAACGESNPGNFDICWSCGGEVKPSKNQEEQPRDEAAGEAKSSD